MIVLGKTHTVEFAMGGWGTNQHLGTPWNPWDLEVAPHARRVEQRLRRRGRGRLGAVGDRHRYRRLGAAAGVVVRPHRAEDDDRPGQHLRHPAARARRSTRRGRWRARSRTRRCCSASCRAPDPLDPRTLSAPPPADPMPTLQARRARAAARRACRKPSATAAPPRCSPPMTRRSTQLARLGAEIVDVALPLPLCRRDRR